MAKERPILFKGPMIRSVLNHTKTQTRRVLSPQPTKSPVNGCCWRRYEGVDFSKNGDATPFIAHLCPYGAAGDKLWARETWMPDGGECREWMMAQGLIKREVLYRAEPLHADRVGKAFKWKPSIFMPRWASRVTLEITGVRVERLDEISREDAIAEGLTYLSKDGGQTFKWGIPDRDGLPGNDDDGWHWADWEVDPIQAYRRLWNKINLAPSPILKEKKVVAYQAFPWSNEDFDAAFPGVRAEGQWRGKPLTVTEDPYVWVVEFKPMEVPHA